MGNHNFNAVTCIPLQVRLFKDTHHSTVLQLGSLMLHVVMRAPMSNRMIRMRCG
jgi:hypothetical protein